MKVSKWFLVAAAMTSASVWAAACADPQQSTRSSPAAAADIAAVSPALDDYRDRVIEGELWQRLGLSPRDRSVVTVAALIARNQSIDMAAQFARALDNGVTAAELSEIITHLRSTPDGPTRYRPSPPPTTCSPTALSTPTACRRPTSRRCR